MEIGDKVIWKAKGKGARADGVAGQVVAGTITGFTTMCGEQYAEIAPDYPSAFTGTCVPVRRLLRARRDDRARAEQPSAEEQAELAGTDTPAGRDAGRVEPLNSL